MTTLILRIIIDEDGDGSNSCRGDCDDSNPDLNGLDVDSDGFSTCDGDCDDNTANLSPSDTDGDGYSTCDNDCDDSDSFYTPLTLMVMEYQLVKATVTT